MMKSAEWVCVVVLASGGCSGLGGTAAGNGKLQNCLADAEDGYAMLDSYPSCPDGVGESVDFHFNVTTTGKRSTSDTVKLIGQISVEDPLSGQTFWGVPFAGGFGFEATNNIPLSQSLVAREFKAHERNQTRTGWMLGCYAEGFKKPTAKDLCKVDDNGNPINLFAALVASDGNDQGAMLVIAQRSNLIENICDAMVGSPQCGDGIEMEASWFIGRLQKGTMHIQVRPQ